MHAKTQHTGWDPIRWLGWAASVLIALLVAPVPFFLLEFWLPTGSPHPPLREATVLFYVAPLAFGVVGVGVFAVPGLVVLRRTGKDGLMARLLLGVGAGLVAASCAAWLMAGNGSGLDALHSLWPLPAYVPLAIGLFGGFVHWQLSQWLPGGRNQVSR
jgi:hypothetical protein